MTRKMSIGSGVTWTIAIALVLIVILWEKRPLTSIGWRMPGVGDLLAALGAFVVFHLIGFVGNQLGSIPNPKFGAALFALPWIARLWMLSGVICEEITFRGYFIERVEELTGSTWIAAILSCVLFGLAHATGGGFGYVFVVTAVATVYATLYVWRRNLPACTLVHFASDLPLVWLPSSPSIWLPRLLRFL